MGCNNSKARRYQYEAPRPHTEFFSHQYLKQKYAHRLIHNTTDAHHNKNNNNVKHLSSYLDPNNNNKSNNSQAYTSKQSPSSSSSSVYKVHLKQHSSSSVVTLEDHHKQTETVLQMQEEIDTLKMNNKLTLEKLENIMNKLDVTDESGLASSMMYTKNGELENEEYNMGQPMDDDALLEFTLSKNQLDEHKWNHIEIKDEFNFDLTKDGGEHNDLLDT